VLGPFGANGDPPRAGREGLEKVEEPSYGLACDSRTIRLQWWRRQRDFERSGTGSCHPSIAAPHSGQAVIVDGPALIQGIKTKLLPLDDINFICGHGPGSSFGMERQSNPFLAD
jgi:hypothetical protein